MAWHGTTHALDFETTVAQEQVVRVADIGGRTSYFSLVRVGPQQRQEIHRKRDILANHGVHVAGTDFDRHLALAHIQRRDDTTMPPAISTNASIW